MLKKLRIKFVCIMMAMVTVMLCVIFALVIHSTRQNLERESMQMLQQAVSNPGFGRENQEDPAFLPYFIITQDVWGTLHVTGTISEDAYETEQFREIWELASRAGIQSGTVEGYDLRFMKAASPAGTRYIFLDISSQRMIMGSLTRTCLIVGAVSFILLLGASVLLARWAVKPVEKAWQQQRQFVADASHELKTPLTVIMTNAELLQSADQDEAARQQSSDSILVMSHQMRGLVEGLLELARVDNGAVKRNAVQLDYSALVEDGLLPFEPLYFEKGLMLTSEVEKGITVKGSEAYLRQVLDVLLDNAMKYSAPNGKVFVVLKKKGNHAALAVANPGDPIPEEELKNIFKRFYRVDKVRSRDGSYGLGLSIAQSIVTEHGGKIWAENDDGWVVFRVQLPIN